MAKEIHATRLKRLKLLVQSLYLNHQTKFANAIGKTTTYVNFLLNDPSLSHHKNLGEDLAREIERKLELPIGWLDREDETDVLTPRTTTNVLSIESNAPLGYVMVARREVRLAAGSGEISFQEDNAPPLAFRKDWLDKQGLKPTSLVVATATGASMQPRILDGDTLMIDTQQTAIVDGRIYAIRVGDELRVKRVFRRTLSILLQSDNKDYPSEELSNTEAGDLHVIGRVVWVSGTL